MTAVATARATKLYTPDMLALATGLVQFPFDPTLPLQAEARSRSCGSVITIGLALHADDRIGKIGLRLSACAIGQASAMLLARGAEGTDVAAITATTDALHQWLAGTGVLPDWPGIELIAPALAHPGRHGALMLPWTAACMALSSNAA